MRTDARAIRAAERRDAEGIRTIYNHYVNDSTTLFDMVARTLDEQVQWIDEHSGSHPAVVADLDGEIVGFGSLSAFRSRPAYSTTVEDSVYLLDGHQGRGIGRLLLDELLRLRRRPRVPLGDRPHHRRERRVDRAPRRLRVRDSWASSGRWAASSASGSTWSRCRSCSEPLNAKRPPSGGRQQMLEWAGLDSNQRSLRSRFTACPLCPLGYRPGAA